jgi:hypothetical protein
MYDTQHEPRLIIPPEKRSRARVQVQYTLRQSTGELSRLAMSVINGVLQSLVDATPSQIGQTYLRPLHDMISEGNTVSDPKNRFFTMATCVHPGRHCWPALVGIVLGTRQQPTSATPPIGIDWLCMGGRQWDRDRRHV